MEQSNYKAVKNIRSRSLGQPKAAFHAFLFAPYLSRYGNKIMKRKYLQLTFTILILFVLKAEATSFSKDQIDTVTKTNAVWNEINKAKPNYKSHPNKCLPNELHTKWGDFFPNGGLRSLYCHFKNIFNIDLIENEFGGRIYLSGPHKYNPDNLYKTDEFGHYNPKFIQWLHDNIIPDKSDSNKIAGSKNIYNYYLKDLIRTYYVVHESLKINTKFKESALKKYIEKIEKNESVNIHEYNECMNLTLKWPNKYKSKRYETIPLLFWLRRSIDGTEHLFNKSFEKLLKAYDYEFLEATTNKANYDANLVNADRCYRYQVYD